MRCALELKDSVPRAAKRLKGGKRGHPKGEGFPLLSFSPSSSCHTLPDFLGVPFAPGLRDAAPDQGGEERGEATKEELDASRGQAVVYDGEELCDCKGGAPVGGEGDALRGGHGVGVAVPTRGHYVILVAHSSRMSEKSDRSLSFSRSSLDLARESDDLAGGLLGGSTT